MPYLSKIVSEINTILMADSLSDGRFSGSQLNGIATSLQKDEGVFIPVVQMPGKAFSEYIEVLPDDKFPIRAYHKIPDAKTYDELEAGRGYGDDDPDRKSSTNMSMIVYGNSNKIKLHADELEALISTNFPKRISKTKLTELKLRSTEVSVISVNFNKVQIAQVEFPQIAGFDVHSPEVILLDIRYKIESTWKAGCFNICDCEQQ